MAFQLEGPAGRRNSTEARSENISDTFVVRNVIVAVAAVVVVHYLWKIIQFRRKTRPPGPFPVWPVLGNIPLVGELAHLSFYKLAQKYGDIMELKLGSTRTLVVSSPAMAKAVLKDHDHIFASRPANIAVDILTYGTKNIAFAPCGEHWRLMRKVCVQELLSAKRSVSFKRSRAEEVSCFVQGVYEQFKDGNPVNMQERLFNLAMNVTTWMLLKKRYFVLDLDKASVPEAKEFREVVAEVMYVTSRFNISDLIPYLKPFDLQGIRARAKRISKRLDTFLEKVMEEHLSETEVLDESEKDFLDVLLSLPGLEEGSDKIDNDSVKAVLLDLILAGADTSSTTIEWALVHLLKHPQVMKKAQDELDAVVGCDRMVEEDDLPKLKFLHAIVKETFRLQPPGSLLVPRQSLAPCDIRGYHIPADTLVFVNAWAIHRHPSVYEIPFEYDPERFVGSEVDVKGQDYMLLPFGSGRRVCPGLPLGRTMVHFGLATLLHSFNCSLPAGEKPEDLDMGESYGLATRKAIPLQVVGAMRLPSHLYPVNLRHACSHTGEVP